MRRLLGTFDAGPPGPAVLDPILRGALQEDSAFDDRSTLPLPGREEPREGRVAARDPGVLAGAPVFRRVFELLAPDGTLEFDALDEGEGFQPGQIVLRVRGPAGVLLSGERTALNFLQRLSAIATRTRDAVEAVNGKIAICDTRKTTPGLRALEKYAVVVGGGTSHRWSLGDMVMLKENHLALAGGIAAAVRAVRGDPGSASLPLTVEVRTFEEAMEAAALAVDRLLLDNLPAEEMRRIAGALEERGERPELEASGGIRLADLPRIAESGVDLASLGSLTHSAPAVDLSFLIEGVIPGMIAAREDILDAQAWLLHELGARGGRMRLPPSGAPELLAEALVPAIRGLESAGLVSRGEGGWLRPGGRGSLLNGPEIEAALSGLGSIRRIETHATVTSTNELALQRTPAEGSAGLVIVAERQTAGRGRRGRSFASAPGLGVWSTTLLEAPESPEFAPRLSLVAAIAVARALEAATRVVPGIKWPNDVRIAGKKLCGILVEARTRGDALFPVAGIGVNVHHRPEEFPAEIREEAGSVETMTGVRVERGRLLIRILRELDGLLKAGSSLDLPGSFAPFDEMRGREVTVRQGEVLWRGAAAGIQADGGLLLALPGGKTRVFRSGDATLREG